MENGRSSERRVKQAEAIRRWSPWKHATGPRTSAGKALASRNAFRGGRRAKLRADLTYIRLIMREIDWDAVA